MKPNATAADVRAMKLDEAKAIYSRRSSRSTPSGFARSCNRGRRSASSTEKEENFFAALREKLKGIKQKLSSAIVIIASAAVTGYDFFAPIVSGVDVSWPHVPGAVMGVAADPDFGDGAVSVPAQSR